MPTSMYSVHNPSSWELGIRNKRAALGLSATLNWVFKDALGKILRMMWASCMGPKFDPDAKRWRYRSSVSIHLCIGEWVGTHDLCLSEFVFVIGDHGKITQTNEFFDKYVHKECLYNSPRHGTRENIEDIYRTNY